MPGRRDAWRLAYDRDDTLIGMIVPSRTAYDPSVSYLGVVPDMRGHGFVNDLLAEITHIHIDSGATRITGITDITNHPTAAAFRRANFRLESVRIVRSAPA